MLTRHRQPELMDEPSLDPEEHGLALDGLATLNALSRSAAQLWQPIKQYALQAETPKLRLLDIATGSADVALTLWHIARQQGFDLAVDGCDISKTALSQARARAIKAGAPANFFKLDILSDELPSGYDIIMCSQFLHHLDEPEVVKVLARMAASTKHMVLVSDLVRSYTNLCLVTLATQLFSRSKIVHFDGPASVKAAYTLPEMSQLAQQAELSNIQLEERFPCRLLMVWRKQLA